MDELTRTNVVPVEATEIHANILSTIGGTPLVRLNRVTRGVQPAVLAKIEFFNPGGSVKDRIGPAIIAEAERTGQLKPGGTIVEATMATPAWAWLLPRLSRGTRIFAYARTKSSDEKTACCGLLGASRHYPHCRRAGRPAQPTIQSLHRLRPKRPTRSCQPVPQSGSTPSAHYRLRDRAGAGGRPVAD